MPALPEMLLGRQKVSQGRQWQPHLHLLLVERYIFGEVALLHKWKLSAMAPSWRKNCGIYYYNFYHPHPARHLPAKELLKVHYIRIWAHLPTRTSTFREVSDVVYHAAFPPPLDALDAVLAFTMQCPLKRSSGQQTQRRAREGRGQVESRPNAAPISHFTVPSPFGGARTP